MSITEIPLSQLVSSPRNVRRSTSASIEGLAASIHAHGLLQNLVVSADGHGKFMVEAGSQRHQAMQLLVKTDRLPAEYAVPCQVLETNVRDFTEASLAENVMRTDMHPADEFDAFAAIVDQGFSIGEVAARFGKEELYVKQRLKLANVAPDLLKMYRAGDADLEQMMALALTDDQALQIRLWKAAKVDWQRRPDRLRDAITEKEMASNSSVGKFITLAVYEKAGGNVRRDLFAEDDEAFLQENELVTKLCGEKLERIAEKIRKEGWLWVDTRIEFDYSDRNAFGKLYPSHSGSKETWTAEQKGAAGAMVFVGYNGQAEISRGLVRPEDRKAAAVAAGDRGMGGKAEKPKAAPGEISFAAVQRLQAEATGILQVQIAELPRTALALLAAELAARAFYGVAGYGHSAGEQRQWVHIQREASGRMPGNLRDVIPASDAGKMFEAIESEWKELLPKKKADLRDWLLQQDFERISKLLAFLAARELDLVDFSASQKQGVVDTAEAAKVDLANHWKPSTEWLATLPKAAIIKIVTEAAGKVAAAPLEKLKKDQIPQAAIGLLPAGWLPKQLRPRAPAKVTTKKTAPAARKSKVTA